MRTLLLVGLVAFAGCKKESSGPGPRSEAPRQLNKIARAAKQVFATTGAFPAGEVGLTPAARCCAGAGAKCPVDAAAWQAPLWKAVEFAIDQPHLFQYSYRSDGKSFTATAVGDLDCDGTPITFVLNGAIEQGNAVTTLVEPPPNAR